MNTKIKNGLLKVSAAVITLALCFNVIAAENKIAVVDIQAAIESSRHMESIQSKLEQEFAPLETDLKKLANDINALQERLVKDAAVIGESESRRLQQEINQKKNAFKFEDYEAKRKLSARQQELSMPVLTLANAALKEIIDEKKLDLVLHKQAVLHNNDAYDITKSLTEKLNKK